VADILSPEEIEALLTSLSGEEGEGASEPDLGPSPAAVRKSDLNDQSASAKSAKAHRNYEIYDFRRPDKLSKEQIRTLSMIHETMARLTSSGLAGFLRAPVQVELMSVEQVPYEEYLRSINQSVFTILSLAPLSGQAVLELEFGLIFGMIDRMLGGPGKTINRSSLTEIERPLVSQLVEKVLASLKSSWEAVVIVNPRTEGMETSAQFVQVAPPTDIALMVLFEVKVGQMRGAMSLCIPYLVLKPIAGKLAGQKWAAAAGRKRTLAHRRHLSMHLTKTEVPCRIELGRVTIGIREFLNLQPGNILTVDRKRSDAATIYVKDIPKFRARPVRTGGKLAVQVIGEHTE